MTRGASDGDSERVRVLEEGEAAFPELAADRARIDAQLAVQLPRDERVEHPADLYLAAACVAGLPRAIERYESNVLRRVRRAVELVLKAPEGTDDVLQKLREKLFLPDSKLRSYRGAGSLSAWTRAIAVRLALEVRAPGGAPPNEKLPAGLAALDKDAETRLLYARHREAFRQAVARAFTGLEVRERNVLRLYLVDELSLDRIGRMYGVDKSSVSRWVARARKRVLGSVREQLTQSLRLEGGEVVSLIRAVRSQLSISLSSLQLDAYGDGRPSLAHSG